MASRRTFLAVAGILGAVVALIPPAEAEAGIQVTVDVYNQSGSSLLGTRTYNEGNAYLILDSIAGVSFELAGLSNTPGWPDLGFLVSQEVTINLATSFFSGTGREVVITATANPAFDSPGVPGSLMRVESEINSYLGLNPDQVTFQSHAGGVAGPVQSPLSNSFEEYTFTRGATYGVTNVTRLTLPTTWLDPDNATVSSTGSTKVFAVVPEPGTLVMAAAGLPLLLVAARVRRRRSS